MTNTSDHEGRSRLTACDLETAYAEALALIRELVDQDDCWFDHHGGCQAHGYLGLEPGEKCPHAEAKALLDQYGDSDV